MRFLKKYSDLFFIMFFIMFMSIIIYLFFIKPSLILNKIDNNLSLFNQSNKTSILYYDNSVSKEIVNIYEKGLNKYPELKNTLLNSDIKIVVSSHSIEDTLFELFEDKSKHPENIKGVYFKSYNLIVLKSFDIEKEILENKITTTSSKKDFNTLNTSINTNVLYHEIGHFIISIKDKDFIKNKNLIKSYNEEASLLFGDNSYARSDIEEFTAECISNYINYGFVEASNKDLEKGYTKTNNLIENFLTIK